MSSQVEIVKRKERIQRLKWKAAEYYDHNNFSKWLDILEGNKGRMQEKLQKVETCLKLADEINKAGVKVYNEGHFKSAKYKFETAMKYLEDIRVLVPNYSSNGFNSLMQTYKENAKRTEQKLK